MAWLRAEVALLGALALFGIGVAAEVVPSESVLHGFSRTFYVLSGLWLLLTLVHWGFEQLRARRRSGPTTTRSESSAPTLSLPDPHAQELAESLRQQDDLIRSYTGKGMREVLAAGPSSTSDATVQYRGRVLDDESGDALVGVYITADREQKRATWTDENGEWTMVLPSGRRWSFQFNRQPEYAPTFQTLGDHDSPATTRLRRAAVPTATSETHGRIFVGPDITPEYLVGVMNEHTEIQAKRLVAPFVGKWMRVSGQVREIGETNNQITASFIFGNASVVQMWFERRWTDQLSVLKKGSQLNVVGRIGKITSLYISLDQCEVVPPGTTQAAQ